MGGEPSPGPALGPARRAAARGHLVRGAAHRGSWRGGAGGPARPSETPIVRRTIDRPRPRGGIRARARGGELPASYRDCMNGGRDGTPSAPHPAAPVCGGGSRDVVIAWPHRRRRLACIVALAPFVDGNGKIPHSDRGMRHVRAASWSRRAAVIGWLVRRVPPQGLGTLRARLRARAPSARRWWAAVGHGSSSGVASLLLLRSPSWPTSTSTQPGRRAHLRARPMVSSSSVPVHRCRRRVRPVGEELLFRGVLLRAAPRRAPVGRLRLGAGLRARPRRRRLGTGLLRPGLPAPRPRLGLAGRPDRSLSQSIYLHVGFNLVAVSSRPPASLIRSVVEMAQGSRPAVPIAQWASDWEVGPCTVLRAPRARSSRSACRSAARSSRSAAAATARPELGVAEGHVPLTRVLELARTPDGSAGPSRSAPPGAARTAPPRLRGRPSRPSASPWLRNPDRRTDARSWQA